MKIPRLFPSLYICLALLLLPVGQALAADITVDAECSLANAILSANGEELLEPLANCEAGDSADGGLDTITIDVSATAESAITLDGTLNITSEVVIEGGGSTVNGAGRQIFNVTSGSLTLKDLTMTGGFGITNGGAVSVADAELTLNNSAIRGSGARGFGGGIYAVNSDVSLINSVVSGNRTGAIIEDFVEVHAADAQTEDNAIIVAGEDDAQHAQAEDEDHEETAAEEVELPEVEGTAGGGVYFAGDSNTLTIERSGLDGNTSPAAGGGLYIASGAANISNSTLSANQAGADGGGLYNAGNSVLTHVTVVDNSAPGAGGIIDESMLQLYNSILSDNTGGDCAGSLNANIGNLIRDVSCNHDGLTDDPILLLLGGSPAYYLPQLGSPAIDAAAANFCTATDQRGIDRLPDACDIGAAEHQPGVFTFQIQSALAAFDTPDPSSSGSDAEPEAIAQPIETPSTCLSLDSHVVVSDVTNSTQCKIVDAGGVGNQTLIDSGFYHAVDIFGYLPAPVKVCIQHDTGAFVLLNAATAPRRFFPLFTWTEDDKLCASVDRPGTAVLMNPEFFTSGAITVPAWNLAGCTVTTTDIMNLRSESSQTSAVLANVLNDVSLSADQKTNFWYRVNYYGAVGWLHAGYLSLSDNC